jgi:Domain of unknown function (DUF4385)
MPKGPSKKTPNSTPKEKDGLVQLAPTPLPTPSLSSPNIKYSYAIARGEQGVLTYEPYKSLILPYWAFRTVPIAQSSSSALWTIFRSYVERSDFVGADMSRKFIQMGMTRARRYANWKGGRKYQVPKDKGGGGEKNQRWTGEGVDGEEGRKRREKEAASETFKSVCRRCVEDEEYQALKEEWMRDKKEWGRRKKDGMAE